MGERTPRKILIVQDDPETVEALRLVLEKNGYGVTAAPNAEDGMKRLRAERPDLVLLDVMMPAGTEGFHFVWTLRKDAEPECRDMPIIVLTTIHESSPLRLYADRTDGAYGPYEYLPVQAFFGKPVDMPKLLGKIEQLLAKKEGAGPT
jgi:CheY-like chemotaxis protein